MYNQFMQYFNNKKILITGGSGFLGRHIIERLKNCNCEILAPRKKECDFIYRWQAKNYLEEHRPDIVLHLAAYYGGLKIHDQYPAKIFYENLMMNTNLMHYSFESGVKKFVSMGSDCSYPGYMNKEILTEEDLWAGPVHQTTQNYGYLKKMNSVMGWTYKKQYGFNSIHLILTNMFGPGDKFDPLSSHVVAALIKKFVEAKKDNLPSVEIWGTGKPTRQFLYVEDAADGILLATEKYNSTEPMNLSTRLGARTIGELAETIKKISGYEGELIYNTQKPDGQMKKILDVSKMIGELGWEPKTSLEDGLKKTIEWYFNNKEKAGACTH